MRCTELQCYPSQSRNAAHHAGGRPETAGPRYVLSSKKTTYYPAAISLVDQVVLPADALDLEVDLTDLFGEVIGSIA